MNTSSRCRKLFVIGCPRSGTTWLSNMLGQHPDILRIPYETWIYKRIYEPFEYLQKITFGQRMKNAKWLLSRYSLFAVLFGIQSRDLWQGILRGYQNEKADDVGLHNIITYQELKALIQKIQPQSDRDLVKAERLIAEIFDLAFMNLGGQPQQILLEKTPEHTRRIPQILQTFPEAKIIEIVRDGRDVCASFQSRATMEKWARRSTVEIINLWQKYIEYGEKARTNSEIANRFYSIRYEHLQENTVIELKKIFEFLDVQCTSERIETIARANHISNIKKKGEGLHVNQGTIGRWKTSLSATDIELWEKLADKTLKRLQYES